MAFPSASSKDVKQIHSKWLPDLNLDTNKGEGMELHCFGLRWFESIFKELYRNIPLGMDCV